MIRSMRCAALRTVTAAEVLPTLYRFSTAAFNVTSVSRFSTIHSEHPSDGRGESRASSAPPLEHAFIQVAEGSDTADYLSNTAGIGASEDAFGESDALKAVENVVRPSLSSSDVPSDESVSTREEIDPIASAVNRRRNRRRRTLDTILGDVLHDALRLRDMGEKPTADFVYKKTQERLYKEEYGHKSPSAKEHAEKYVPFPPDFQLHRLLGLYGERYGPRGNPKRGMREYCLMEEDPWPEREVTPENPVWTRRQVEEDRIKTGGEGLRKWERKLFSPREGYDLSGEFLDAMDELAHWEARFLIFLRTVPLSQRRSLPFLHEYYRLLVHRVIRAERRYLITRDAALAQAKAPLCLYKRSEERIERVRSLYAEVHRSLSSASYDPLRMKKSALTPFLRMSDTEFKEWREMEKERRNAVLAELS